MREEGAAAREDCRLDGLYLGLEQFECLADQGIVFELCHRIFRRLGCGWQGRGKPFTGQKSEAQTFSGELFGDILKEFAVVGLIAIFHCK